MDERRERGGSVSWPAALGGGLLAGIIAGLFGVGGGLILVPLLVIALKRDQHVAHATSLVAVTMAAASGLIRFAADGAYAPIGGLLLAVGAITGARLGALLLPRISADGLRRVFVFVVLVLAIRFLLTGAGGAETVVAGDVVPDVTGLTLVAHLVGGLLAGVTSSVLGVGGGVIMVPLLVLGLGYGQHVAEGTSLAVIIPTAATGAWGHHRNGYTDWRLGVRLGLGGLVGGIAGASLALSLSPTVLGRLYGVLQLVIAAVMWRQQRRTTADPVPLD